MDEKPADGIEESAAVNAADALQQLLSSDGALVLRAADGTEVPVGPEVQELLRQRVQAVAADDAPRAKPPVKRASTRVSSRYPDGVSEEAGQLFITLSGAASLLRQSQPVMKKMVESGYIEATKVGVAYRINFDDVLRLQEDAIRELDDVITLDETSWISGLSKRTLMRRLASGSLASTKRDNIHYILKEDALKLRKLWSSPRAGTFSYSEAGQRLGLSESTIRTHVFKQTLEGVTVEGERRVSKRSVLVKLKKRRSEAEQLAAVERYQARKRVEKEARRNARRQSAGS